MCGKKTAFGNNVSHSNRKTRRRFLCNLKRVRVLINGIRKKIRVCTRCLKSGKIFKAA